MAQGRPSKNPSRAKQNGNGANVGYEAQLWQMADALRGSMDASEYKHVVLGLIFLKYISDAFEEQHAKLVAEKASGADPEDPDEYRAQNIFWVPPEARWAHMKAQAKQPTIGQLVDDAMEGIERDNPVLKGVLPKDYARPALDKLRLGLSEDELAFYDALETNDSAVKVLGDETLRTIARELMVTVRNNVTIDWTIRENVRAQLRVLVKRILRKYGYPPDKQEKATQMVLEQAEALSAEWAA
jgi:Domain of unknown function (DUF3387)/HsdM N-terminal domain